MKTIVNVLLLVGFFLFMDAEVQATTTIGRGIVLEVGKAKGAPTGGDVLTERQGQSSYLGIDQRSAFV